MVDADYLEKLCVVFRDYSIANGSNWYAVEALTKNKERFIETVKFYIRNRQLGPKWFAEKYPDAEFNEDYSKVKIYRLNAFKNEIKS